ncbi:glycosyltransferase family 4 protein [Nodularia harveyana UHCC-0300]|uniref:Glycosyltransferase family 4 protein n=1 Tax=Nodularia harveyana UHCC-0300 TaxID=2974287 RepID=A0ABU5UCX0_9CYAN|nr:glycosyltransferase family 4 protein [Nodularia harveyana]MEA5581218.1 glycosyltransferase family 4 protein [Nodularia harveyana UHCC-0300]
MENISEIPRKIREQTASPDILVISRFFLPKKAVIGEYLYNRCLQDPERVMVLAAGCAGDRIFDEQQQFPVYRWLNARYWLRGYLQPAIDLVCSFLLAIKLYLRYHYRYIEWGHGYQFPVLLLLSYILPIRFFIHLHGSDILNSLHNPLWRSLLKLTLTRAAGIVCNSYVTQDYLRKTFRLQTPIHVIQPVVRPEKFGVDKHQGNFDDLRQRVRKAYNIPETAIVILSVGRLIKQKRFEQVIENLPLLLNNGIDVHYLVCGQGTWETPLKNLAQRLRVDQRVHFTGYVPDGELAGYYAACDLFAMLNSSDSQEYIQGLGIVYLEASYFGKPVIAARLGSVIDIVRHEENGILVNPQSGYEVFQAFKRLCNDPQLREKLGRKGKELARRKTLHRSIYLSEPLPDGLLN